MIIRVRSAGGMKRVSAGDSDTVEELFKKVAAEFHLDVTFTLCHRPDGTQPITRSQSTKTLRSLNIKHGQMLHLLLKEQAPKQQQAPLEMDTVDVHLNRLDGLVHRKRDPLLCHHSDTMKCIHCVPLEPFDEKVLNAKDPPIKFLAFHSYLRQLNTGADKGKFTTLEPLQCCIKPGCTSHPPWPEGICTKCQPSAITLKRQSFRHVDYVEFENSSAVNRFIGAWRGTGAQRTGLLYGRYEPYEQVPLGIKAVVVAIYEPPQVNESFSLELLTDPNAAKVEALAKALGLQPVGWIFTDLEPEPGSTTGEVIYKRYFGEGYSVLSGGEIILAALLQNQHPNVVASKYTSSRRFGSKFVTVCVSGGQDNLINLKAYQTSDQAMALVDADCLRPSPDKPDVIAIKPSSDEQYIPDVFFVQKDEYKNEIKQPARPTFPLEYLIVDFETGTKTTSTNPTFEAAREPFAVENREALGELQDLGSLAAHLAQAGSFLAKISDFHALVYIATCETFSHLGARDLQPLLEAVRLKDSAAADAFRASSEQWKTVEMLLGESASAAAASSASVGGARGGGGRSSSSGGAAAGGALWACKHCTFHNPPGLTSCSICGLPR